MPHNPYLHLFIENFNRKNVPDALIFRNRFISVSVDDESQKEDVIIVKQLLTKSKIV